MNNKNSVACKERVNRLILFLAICVTCLAACPEGFAQNQAATDATEQERIRMLTSAMERVESQMQESQRELAEIKKQLADLRGLSSANIPQASETPNAAKELSEAVANVRETQAVDESQIATLGQMKVESASTYPLKVSRMI